MAQIEFQSPGVFGIEKTPATAPDSLSPAVAGFIGWTDEGPVNTPVKVRSIEEFTSRFGQITSLGIIPISMRGYFGTGGRETWIVRVVPADAVTATSLITGGAPAGTAGAWTFSAIGEGVWGNELDVLIRGNRNFLNRTTGEWEKFDVLIRRPSAFDPTIAIAAEVYEAVQFDDPTSGDFVLNVITDERNPSQLVTLVQGAGGTPTALFGADVTDEVIGSGTGIALDNYTATLASVPVLDLTVNIKAQGALIADEAQTPVPTPNDVATNFTMTLPSGAVLDDSVRLFAGAQPVLIEAATVAPVPNSAATGFTIAAGSLSAKVHRETSVFRIRYASTASASGPNLLHTDVGGLTHDLSTTPVTVGLPMHPGTLTVDIDIGSGPVTQTASAAGVFPITPELPAGGTVDFDTGAMTGVTAALLAASTINESHNTASVITKTSSGDNLEVAAALAGALGVGTNTIDLVDSIVTPTGNGLIDFEAAVAPLTGIPVYVDFVPLLVVDDDIAGALTGDVGVGTNTVDHSTGDIDVTFSAAPGTGITIDASYSAGLIVTDDGLGNLIGDVDLSGTNTINYDTGAIDVTFSATVPVAVGNILADYRNLPKENIYPFTLGANGTAIGRSDISDPLLLESQRKGIYALDSIEEPINVVVPDFEGVANVQLDLIDFAENRNQGPGTRFAILGASAGMTVPEVIQYNQVTLAADSRAAAFYYPNVRFVNEINNTVELLPVTPFIAAVYAKTAANKNVGKSPGGVEDGALDAPGTVGPELELTLSDRDALYQSRINPVFTSSATGFVVWGVRTLSLEPRWRYVNARLLHNFLMHRLFLILQFAVFENNGPALWLRIEQAVKGFMDSLFRLGYFAGNTAAEAFFVKANASNNNAATVNQGRVIVDIGFSPNKPAEFVIFRLQQPAGQTTP